MLLKLDFLLRVIWYEYSNSACFQSKTAIPQLLDAVSSIASFSLGWFPSTANLYYCRASTIRSPETRLCMAKVKCLHVPWDKWLCAINLAPGVANYGHDRKSKGAMLFKELSKPLAFSLHGYMCFLLTCSVHFKTLSLNMPPPGGVVVFFVLTKIWATAS